LLLLQRIYLNDEDTEGQARALDSSFR
jgi:hypothetical protein